MGTRPTPTTAEGGARLSATPARPTEATRSSRTRPAPGVSLGGFTTSAGDVAASTDLYDGSAYAKVQPSQGGLDDGALLWADGEAEADGLNSYQIEDPPREEATCDTASGSSSGDDGDPGCIYISDPTDLLTSTSTCL